jgi:hypothetical protein
LLSECLRVSSLCYKHVKWVLLWREEVGWGLGAVWRVKWRRKRRTGVPGPGCILLPPQPLQDSFHQGLKAAQKEEKDGSKFVKLQADK